VQFGLSWVYAALAAAAIAALVNVVDSHIISRRMPSLWSFLIPAGVLHTIFGLILIGVFPLPGDVSALTWFIAILSAVLRTAAVTLMLGTMRTEEVSRIIPVVHTYPVFVALIAIPVLDETLSLLQWLAVFMTVGGAVLISIRSRGEGRKSRLRRSFTILLASSVLFGAANVASKYALDYISFWNMYSITGICLGLVFCLISVRPAVLAQLRNLPGKAKIATLIFSNESLALSGVVLSFVAMERGPISLASTVMAIRPLFVFAYALVLSVVLPAMLRERFTPRVVVLKIVSIGLIVGGVAIINLVGQ
jgi:drug/metabolite transporter (DMT)-like permease